MKCPKCGYLGFETTDRCRNCQYDFSLAPFTPEMDLTLQSSDGPETNPTTLELDQLFGDTEPLAPAEPVASVEPVDGAAEPLESLPFDEAPIVPPPAARTPLAVRRATNDAPRNRPRTTRPVRAETLQLEPDQPEPPPSPHGSMSDTVASLMEMPSIGARIGAGAIDTSVLVVLDATILYLTLRVAGLQNTMDDVRILPVIPFVGFLALLAFAYVAAFTVAGGQTIGKMLLSLRVIGDDGRRIDAAGGMLRAAGCMLVPITFGLSYVPALVTSDHRALHDRLAGTRVVRD